MNTISTSAQLAHLPGRQRTKAECRDRAIEMAEAADAAAREAIDAYAKTKDWGDVPEVILAARVAEAAGASAQAWAAVAALLHPNGQKD